MKRILSEPLLHFLILGAALFSAYAIIERRPGPGREEIVVSAGQIENLATAFARVWQRAPTGAELRGLIDDHVKEEVLSREAVKLGLDRDDTIIRRRLRQKMEFLAEDFAGSREPTEAELGAYLRGHAEEFREPPRFTFRHVFLSADRGERLRADAEALLARLRADPAQDASALGDRFLGPDALTDEPSGSLASQFGPLFPGQLDALSLGEWAGPVRSGFGDHLVRLTARTEGRSPTLEAARDAVRRELVAERRRVNNRAFLDALLARYQVRIEAPGAEAGVRPVSHRP